ncbi:MAG TPA: RluA family pseudouridine synthase [Kofleriaceae bacterium]|nr:RluA family pseudouridine synthase [Kofleriaceae bacterium]
MTAPILVETPELIAVAKPPGITVIPGRNEPPEACLRAQLEAARGEKLWVVHRIDRDTSGVVVFARTAEAHRALSQVFEKKRAEKRYLAFAHAPAVAEGRITLPLRPARKSLMKIAERGDREAQAAETHYVVIEKWTRGDEHAALIEARPLTGRQHQIRLHLAATGAPIWFDPLYGEGAAPPDAPPTRLALHAARLALPTPSGPWLRIEAPLPDDLVALRAWLDGAWSKAEG